MTIALCVLAVAMVIVAMAFSFACGIYVGKYVPKPKEPPKVEEPSEKEKAATRRYQRDLANMLTYDGTENGQIKEDING